MSEMTLETLLRLVEALQANNGMAQVGALNDVDVPAIRAVAKQHAEALRHMAQHETAWHWAESLRAAADFLLTGV